LATRVTLSTLVAPFFEETLKGIAVLIIFLIFRADFDSPLDGVVYAGIAALGFAASENTWYIYQLGYLPGGMKGLIDLALIRTLMVGWQHPFYSSFIGIGFALSRSSQQRLLRWLYPLLGWSLAVSFHLSHNFLSILFHSEKGLILSTIWDWSGYLGLLFLITVFIHREQNWMREYLKPELEDGIIDQTQYRVACSAWEQSRAYLRGLLTGNYHTQRIFYQTCGDLMHKKRQLSRLGNQQGEQLIIQRLRSEIAALRESLLHPR
jgi:hypothetical protein